MQAQVSISLASFGQFFQDNVDFGGTRRKYGFPWAGLASALAELPGSQSWLVHSWEPRVFPQPSTRNSSVAPSLTSKYRDAKLELPSSPERPTIFEDPFLSSRNGSWLF